MGDTMFYLFGGDTWDNTPQGIDGFIGVFNTLGEAVDAIDIIQSPAQLKASVKPTTGWDEGNIRWAQVAIIDSQNALRVVAWFNWRERGEMDKREWQFEEGYSV